MQFKKERLTEDKGAISEIVGMLLSLTLTMLIFAILVTAVMMFVRSNPAANVVVQGVVYDGGNGIILSHAGGDAVPISVIFARVFINDTNSYEPSISLLTNNYFPDDDNVWELGDKLLLNQNLTAGSKLEVTIIDIRYDNVIAKINIDRV